MTLLLGQQPQSQQLQNQIQQLQSMQQNIVQLMNTVNQQANHQTVNLQHQHQQHEQQQHPACNNIRAVQHQMRQVSEDKMLPQKHVLDHLRTSVIRYRQTIIYKRISMNLYQYISYYNTINIPWTIFTYRSSSVPNVSDKTTKQLHQVICPGLTSVNLTELQNVTPTNTIAEITLANSDQIQFKVWFFY